MCLCYNQIMAQMRIKNDNYHMPLLVLREEHWRKLDTLERTCSLVVVARPLAQLMVLYGHMEQAWPDVLMFM